VKCEVIPADLPSLVGKLLGSRTKPPAERSHTYDFEGRADRRCNAHVGNSVNGRRHIARCGRSTKLIDLPVLDTQHGPSISVDHVLGRYIENLVGAEPTARTECERKAVLGSVGAIEELCNVGLAEPDLHVVAVVVLSEIHVRVARFPVSFGPVDRRLGVVGSVISQDSVRLGAVPGRRSSVHYGTSVICCTGCKDIQWHPKGGGLTHGPKPRMPAQSV